MNEQKRLVYVTRNILSPDGNRKGKTRQLHESIAKQFTYTDKHNTGIRNVSRIRQTNKETLDKAK
jgi:hypothetical protein